MIHVLEITGRGDMGAVASPLQPPRFYLPGKTYELVSVHGTFTGGSGTANAKLWVDSRMGSAFDRVVYDLGTVGSGGDGIELRVLDEERDTFRFHYNPDTHSQDELTIVWTDPDVGDATEWGLIVELREVK